ncbi:hypothetical protein LJC35_06745 [Parabacteroides sp. OttesenSCG-928-N08]|nr:hypothetical protein [Parabacteroides sp. OttesenSCG-928-N08]
MDTEEQKIEQLTRKLMESTAERPSSALLGKIMGEVRKSQPSIRRIYIPNKSVFSTPIGGLLIYILLAIIGLFLFYYIPPEQSESVLIPLKAYFPLILTVGGCISLFFFLTKLERWLHMKMK